MPSVRSAPPLLTYFAACCCYYPREQTVPPGAVPAGRRTTSRSCTLSFALLAVARLLQLPAVRHRRLEVAHVIELNRHLVVLRAHLPCRAMGTVSVSVGVLWIPSYMRYGPMGMGVVTL